MKLKDIAKLCKARGIITLTPVGGTQWIGDLGAAFPALGMPFMDEETVGVCLDFDEKTREKVKVCNITFTDYELDEYVEGDKELTSVLLRFLYYGRTVDAWSTADGDVVFLDAAYTKPLLADDDRTQLFVRHKIGRNFGYVIGKSGMFVTAIIDYEIPERRFRARFVPFTRAGAGAERGGQAGEHRARHRPGDGRGDS